MNITPDFITSLRPNQIFCYGANSRWVHGAGAAKTALNKFGAKMGVGPFCGQSYGICTKDHNIETLPVPKIKAYVDEFLVFARGHPEYDFLVTKVGMGLAGLTLEETAPLFEKAVGMNNVYLPKEFFDFLKKSMDSV